MAASFTQSFSTSVVPVDAYADAIVDRTFWNDRLAAVGGPGGRITSFEGDGKKADVTQVQVIAKDLLPQAVTAFLPGDLEIERHEIWTRTADGADGRFTASVAGAPATVDGTLSIRSVDKQATVTVHGEVEVKVPLIGGRIEKMIIEQLQELIKAEHGFAVQWLESR
ncbi:DUF2505 domain-containing protein [Millisia brevis]|uniref:DUF2505 domain-containing protein n=1 Tax=Millisia brevis TaxID=264148 RepID=UPI000836B8C0|nr:DUF2505 domain-containing protein [Millisia brevis]